MTEVPISCTYKHCPSECCAICLRAWYAMSGIHIAYAMPCLCMYVCAYQPTSRCIPYPALVWPCSVLSAYARAMQCPVRTLSMSTRVCYAKRGTDRAHASAQRIEKQDKELKDTKKDLSTALEVPRRTMTP
eukprot:988872-Rhodomonas_salina.2